MARNLTTRLVATSAGIGMILATPGLATASSDVATSDQSRVDGQAMCVIVATESARGAWTCLGGWLSRVDNSGNIETTLISDAGAITEVHTTPESVLQDDYDTWCEAAPTCSRKINTYAAEDKGNGTYGYGAEVVGTFDVVLRTNLNGRQPQWVVSLIHDSGPALTFSDVQANCKEELDNFFDRDCGNYIAGSPRIGPAPLAGRWNSARLFASRLENSNEYHADVNGRFTPDGYDPLLIGTLRAQTFYCYGTLDDFCYFP